MEHRLQVKNPAGRKHLYWTSVVVVTWAVLCLVVFWVFQRELFLDRYTRWTWATAAGLMMAGAAPFILWQMYTSATRKGGAGYAAVSVAGCAVAAAGMCILWNLPSEQKSLLHEFRRITPGMSTACVKCRLEPFLAGADWDGVYRTLNEAERSNLRGAVDAEFLAIGRQAYGNKWFSFPDVYHIQFKNDAVVRADFSPD